MEQEQLTPNMQKFHNYQTQFTRLKKAMREEFYLEAIFICYAIMEDRTESILRHTGKWDAFMKNRKGHNVTIDAKIRYIQAMAEEKSSLLHRYLADGTLQQILDWKNERNRLVHALLKQAVSAEELAALATTGQTLACTLRTKVSNLNRALKAAEEKAKQ